MDFWGTCHSHAFLLSTFTGHISSINLALVKGDEWADRVPTIIEMKFQQGMKACSGDSITALKTKKPNMAFPWCSHSSNSAVIQISPRFYLPSSGIWKSEWRSCGKCYISAVPARGLGYSENLFRKDPSILSLGLCVFKKQKCSFWWKRWLQRQCAPEAGNGGISFLNPSFV